MNILLKNYFAISFILNLLPTNAELNLRGQGNRELLVAPQQSNDYESNNESVIKSINWKKFISNKGLKADYTPDIQTLIEGDHIILDGKQYEISDSNLDCIEIFTSDAECTINGISTSCANMPCTTFVKSADELDTIVTVDTEGDIRSIDVVEKTISTGEIVDDHMETVTGDILSRIKNTDIDMTASDSMPFEDETVDDERRNLAFSLKDRNTSMDSRKGEKGRRSLQSWRNCASYREAEIAIAFDSTFCTAEGGKDNAIAEIQSIVALASMSYQTQGICLKLVINKIDGYCIESSDTFISDPYADGIETNKIRDLMKWLQKFWKNNRSYVKADAVHLFYNQRLSQRNKIGGAKNKICDNAFGVNDMSFDTGLQKRAFLFAHELSRNFGLGSEDNGRQRNKKNKKQGNKENKKNKKSKIKYIQESAGFDEQIWDFEDIEEFNANLESAQAGCLTEVEIIHPSSSPSKSPSGSPSVAPSSSPTPDPQSKQCVPAEVAVFEQFKKNDNSWTNMNVYKVPGYGKVLGRFNKNLGEMSKTFTVPKDADSLTISFKFFEFDNWNGDETVSIIINDEVHMSLGTFVNNKKQNDAGEVDYSTNVMGVTLERRSEGTPTFLASLEKNKDEIYAVKINVPNWEYSESGTIDFKIQTVLNNESAGIDRFKIMANRNCD